MSQPVDASTEAAQMLLQARRTGRPIENLPLGCRPESHADAYRIQDAIIESMGGIGGWKIFAADDPTPMLSPVPASLIYPQDHAVMSNALPITLVELEVAIVLRTDLPARERPYTDAELRAAIASVHPLIELITLSWIDRDNVDRVTQLADLQNSAGFVVGPALTDWGGLDPSKAAATLIFDGTPIGTETGGVGIEPILRTLARLADHADQRGLPLRRGHVITTGARLVRPTGTARHIEGHVERLGAVRVSLA